MSSSYPYKLRSSGFKKSVFLYITAVLLILTFYLGIGYGQLMAQKDFDVNVQGSINNQEIPEYLKNDVDFGLFWLVWQTVKEQFYQQPVLDTKLFYGSIEGMVNSLNDPYTVFMNPEITKEFMDDIQGTFDGIGAEIGFRNGLLTIISPLPDSPAQKAGIEAGDIVLSIDGKETFNLTLFEAVRRIKGEKGTIVVLEIAREGLQETKEIHVTRDTIYVRSLTYEIMENGTIGYIKLNSFHEDTMELLRGAIQEFERANVNKIILDLRNNAGGFLQTAIEVASLWVDTGKPVVYEQNARGQINAFDAIGQPILKNKRTVVLINRGSASASEIVAGALQDYALAHIIGTPSFGKGSVQTFSMLADGSSLKITIAQWLTPLKRHIHEIGIHPDREVNAQDQEPGQDRQLQAAIDYLR